MHYKLMYPSEYLAACDLLGRDVTLTVAGVEIEAVVGADGKKQEKPVVSFTEGKAKKKMVLCKTNAKTIAGRHGTNTDDWIGKKITVYPTTCQAFGQTVECIRVR